MKHHKHASHGRIVTTLFLASYGITLVVAGLLYVFLSRSALNRTQQDLATIAERTANRISVIAHEQLKVPEDQDSDSYRSVEQFVQSVMSGNPKIDDVYTLRPTDTPHLMTFVVSGKPTYDYDHDGIIDENEMKAMLGEEYDTEGQPDLEQGLIAPTYDRAITHDKWGSWLSGYAPLKDLQGKTVALVGVDYSAKVISNEMMGLLGAIIWVMVGAIPLYAGITWLLVKAIRHPYRKLAEAMDHVSSGNVDYEMPVPKHGEGRILAEFFNAMKRELLAVAKGRHTEKDGRE